MSAVFGIFDDFRASTTRWVVIILQPSETLFSRIIVVRVFIISIFVIPGLRDLPLIPLKFLRVMRQSKLSNLNGIEISLAAPLSRDGDAFDGGHAFDTLSRLHLIIGERHERPVERVSGGRTEDF